MFFYVRCVLPPILQIVFEIVVCVMSRKKMLTYKMCVWKFTSSTKKKFASNLGEVFGGKFALNASKKFALFLAGRHFY
jgi:hypothetical protein